jgi:predicted DNA-binding protein
LSGKLTATDHRSRLKAKIFEELQILKSVWHHTTVDLVQLNSEDIEEVTDEFEDFFLADEEMRIWDEEENQGLMDWD